MVSLERSKSFQENVEFWKEMEIVAVRDVLSQVNLGHIVTSSFPSHLMVRCAVILSKVWSQEKTEIKYRYGHRNHFFMKYHRNHTFL